MTRDLGSKRVVPQRTADGSGGAVEEIGQGEIGGVRAARDLAERQEDPFAEGCQPWVLGDFRRRLLVHRCRRRRRHHGFRTSRRRRRRGSHGGPYIALAPHHHPPLGFLGIRKRAVPPLPFPLRALPPRGQALPIEGHQVGSPVGDRLAQLDAGFELPGAHVLGRGGLQDGGPGCGWGVFVGTVPGGIADDSVEDDAGKAVVEMDGPAGL